MLHSLVDFEILLNEIIGHFGPTYTNFQFLVSKPTELQNYYVFVNRESQFYLNFRQKDFGHFGPLI